MAMKRIAAGLVFAVALTGCGANIDSAKSESQIESWAEDIVDEPVAVDCGDENIPDEIDSTFECDLTDSTGSYTVTVTILEDTIRWEVPGWP
ncbi:MAG TPA: hypothetical protein DCE75_07505 [Acidimicrobiaceae bacterium]|jgi:hypothetical protein|nr:hypothetical protein [Acidimicrobiaceae bacterium]|tara:strand:- start:496 stop:771 length:276 start_codon:yes stop_codon:yes gene_type:complete